MRLYPIILALDQTHYVENLFLKQGLHPAVASRIGEDHTIAAMVANGFGLAVIPYNERLTAYGTQLIPLSDPGAYRIFYLSTSLVHPLSSQARNFRSFVIAESRKNGLLYL